MNVAVLYIYGGREVSLMWRVAVVVEVEVAAVLYGRAGIKCQRRRDWERELGMEGETFGETD